MRVVILFILCLSMLAIAQRTKHTLLLEPTFGLGIARSIDSPTNDFLIGATDSEIKNGFYRGVRVGYANQRWQLALDVSSEDKHKTETDYKYNPVDLGLFAGLKFAQKFRIFVQGFFGSSMSVNNNSVSPFFYRGGVGFGAGGSYYLMKYLAINASFRSLTYSSIENSSIDGSSTVTSTIVSLSFPFEFDFTFWYL